MLWNAGTHAHTCVCVCVASGLTAMFLWVCSTRVYLSSHSSFKHRHMKTTTLLFPVWFPPGSHFYRLSGAIVEIPPNAAVGGDY